MTPFNNLRMEMKEALTNMWNRISARIEAIEEGGGGGGVTGVKGSAESAYRTGNVNLTPANIGAMADTAIIASSTSIPIPASGNSASYSMTGLTSDHELVRWNFSASKENAPPVGLTLTTYNGYFTITNDGGTTSESIRPVFALPTAITITAM